jgi:hypothetical protein
MRWALAELDQLYPLTLKGWDHQRTVGMDVHDHTAVIKLARDIHMPWLLPSAFFQVFIQSVTVQSDYGHPLVCFICGGLAAKLSSIDYNSILGASANVMSGSTFISDGLRSPSSSDCPDRMLCSSRASQFVDTVLRGVCVDPLSFLASPVQWTALRSEVCSDCGDELRGTWKAKRIMFWNALPAMFGLSSWDYMEMERVDWMESNSSNVL